MCLSDVPGFRKAGTSAIRPALTAGDYCEADALLEVVGLMVGVVVGLGVDVAAGVGVATGVARYVDHAHQTAISASSTTTIESTVRPPAAFGAALVSVLLRVGVPSAHAAVTREDAAGA